MIKVAKHVNEQNRTLHKQVILQGMHLEGESVEAV